MNIGKSEENSLIAAILIGTVVFCGKACVRLPLLSLYTQCKRYKGTVHVLGVNTPSAADLSLGRMATLTALLTGAQSYFDQFQPLTSHHFYIYFHT